MKLRWGNAKTQDYTVLLPWPIKNLLSELHELPPIPATINGAPQSIITADQRAQIMGIAEENADGQTTAPKSATVKHMIPSLMSNSTKVTKCGKQVPVSASDQILGLANFINLFISATVTFFKTPSTETDWRKGASGGVLDQTMSSLLTVVSAKGSNNRIVCRDKDADLDQGASGCSA